MKKIYLPIAFLLTGVFGNSQSATEATSSFDTRLEFSPNQVRVTGLQPIAATNSVELRWATSNDETLDRLEVERSINGADFDVVGSVSAQDNVVGTKYTFRDGTPAQGQNFYRLRLIGRTGGFSYSRIVKINMGEYRTDVVVLPNPVQSGIMNLQLNNFVKGKYAVVMYNSAGQPVLRRTMNHAGGNSTEHINLPATIKKGIYFLQITNGATRMNKQVMVD